jgi:hypothetical protein
MPYALRLPRFWLAILLCVLLAVFLVPYLSAQGNGTCGAKDYKIMSPSSVAVRCPSDVSGLGIKNVSLYVLGDTRITPLDATVTVSHFTTTKEWLLLTVTGAEATLKPKQRYRVLLTYTGTDAAGNARTEPVDIDSTGTVAITPSAIKSQPQEYRATSHVGFSLGAKRLASARTGPDQPCQIPLQDDTKKRLSVSGRCSHLDSLSSDNPSQADLANVDPDRVGLYVIELDQVPRVTLIPSGLSPLQDIFGNALQIDPKSRLSPQKAPATKDASQYYINFNYAAGVGTVPAWVLDAKIAPQSGIYRGFTFGPLASANVGNNKLKGQTYTDTIDLGGTAQRIFQPNGTLEELLFTPGATYETDKKFDRHNLLATIDLRYNFAGLYHTQSIGTLQKYYSAVQAAKKKKQEDPNSRVIEPQLDDVRPVLFGYALDFHTGLETGGALLDSTVNASSGKATLTLPTYSIVRVVPQIHNLLEIWKFSLDTSMTGRYLVTMENTVVETPSHALFLKRVQGWKGVLALTGTYNLDPQGHFGITIGFKDGFAPPTYQRVNAVQAGLLLKY